MFGKGEWVAVVRVNGTYNENRSRKDFEKRASHFGDNNMSGLKLTQNEMSQKLLMSESSYSEIETWRSMCGTLTATLLYLEQEDINACLNDIKRKLELEFQLI